MMSPTRRLDSSSTKQVSADVAKTVREIEDGDVVVVNRDGRTWLVTDVAEVSVADDDTDRREKRAVRMQSHRGTEPDAATVALVLVRYPDHEEAAVHILEAANLLEKDGVYSVDHVEILEPEPSWVVVQRAGHSKVFHLPAPVPAASGDALPACVEQRGDVDAEDYRLVSRQVVTPGRQVCRDCARRQRYANWRPWRVRSVSGTSPLDCFRGRALREPPVYVWSAQSQTARLLGLSTSLGNLQGMLAARMWVV